MSEQFVKWKEKKGDWQKGRIFIGPLLVYAGILFLILVSFQIFTTGLGVQEAGGSLLFLPLLLLSVAGPYLWKEGMGRRVSDKTRRLGGLGLVSALVVGVCVGYALPSYDLPGGIQSVAYLCGKHWKSTFGMQLWSNPGNIQSQRLATEFLFLIAVILLHSISLLIKKQWFVLLWPTMVTVFALMVGVKPTWTQLVLLFVGVIVFFYLEHRRRIIPRQFLGVVGVAFLLTIAVKLFLEPSTAGIYELREDCLNFQTKLVETLKGTLKEETDKDGKKVSNDAPKHSQQEIMYLTISKIPENSVYLRGTHWGDYRQGYWKEDEDFEKACMQKGYDFQRTSQRVFSVSPMSPFCTEQNLVRYHIRYSDVISQSTYLPYGVWSGVNNDSPMAVTQEVYIAQGVRGLTPEEEDASFYAWYNEYVMDHYLQVGKEMKQIRQQARVYKEDSSFQTALNTIAHASDKTGELNRARLELATLVAEDLKQEGYYTLHPKEIARGEDVVEAFLQNGKFGYCVHFASSGVLLLRELGVPARYVTGYLAKRGAMSRQDQGCQVSIKDADAHAWVEIYLDNYGWVPVEVTPGHGDVGMLQEEEQPEIYEPNNEPNGTESNQTSEPEQQVENEPESPQVPTEEELPGTEQGQQNGEKDNGKVLLICFILPMVTCLAGIWVFCMIKKRMPLTSNGAGAVKKRPLKKDRKVQKYVRQGQTRKAVLRMNEEIYLHLKKCNSAVKGKYKNISDEEYFSLLRENFPQDDQAMWVIFAETVRKAAYSREKISEEEARLCYNIYQALGKK